MPTFRDGDQTDFSVWLMQRLNSPGKTLQGRIVVGFSITAQGRVQNPNIMQNTTGSEEMAQEVLRVMGTSPQWTPAKDESGQPVDINMAVPVLFKSM